MQNEEKDLAPRTKSFARRIIRLYVALPKNNVLAQVLGKQFLRSGTSVGANYREANRARSKAEFIANGDCLKEADETLYWLELLSDENVITSSRLRLIIAEADELVAIFTTISKRARGDE